MSDRALPQNADAERGLIGVIMDRNDVLFEVSHIVARQDFIEPMHGEVFTLLRDMIETGKEAKPGTMLHDLNQDADIGGIKTSEYLALLMRDAPDASMAPTFARTIRDLAMRRRFIAVALKHLDEAYSAPATISAQEIEARYHAASSSLFATVEEAGMQNVGDLTKAVLDQTQAALQGNRRLGLSSGLKAFDDLAGSILPGRLISLSGASGSGKTALAWQIARFVARREPVLFQSIEMDGSELAVRDLSAASGVPGERIDRADLSDGEFNGMIDAYEREQKSLNLYVDSAKSPTVGSIRGKAMRLKRMKGLKLLVIDHLRYIKSSSRTTDIFEQMHDNLQALNALADDLDVAVLLLCQLKASYGSEPKLREPNVGDIFNGAVVEQESDVLMLVHREEYMLARRKPTVGQAGGTSQDINEWAFRMEKSKGRAQLLLNKRRSGPGYGSRTVGFHAASQRFTDELPKEEFALMAS